ncbi:MAG: tetratricopeptide repeat protein [Rhodobacteraceae bacterium]|nr:tetratricopeptide repeat protein [Paracoccaceae bacterium]
MLRSKLLVAGTLAIMLLAACESTEDRVDRLYSEAQELAAEGEAERARIVLKNLFVIDGYHRDARLLYAEQSRLAGDPVDAYRNYLLVAEQNPDYGPVRVTLAEMAADSNDWTEAERHITAAEDLGASDPRLDALRAALDYREAIQLDDAEAMAAAQQAAAALVEAHPETIMAHRVLIDTYVRDGQPYKAIDAAIRALEVAPLDREINRVKLGLLAQTEQMDLVGEHLQTLVDRFPEDETYRSNLISWYLSNDDIDGAETFIRGLVDTSGEDQRAQFALVQFLRQIRGPEAALEELDQMIAAAEQPLAFERMKGAMLFDIGQREEAMAGVEALIAGSEPSTERRDLQVTLARMHLATGDEVRAKELVDEVLAEDTSQVDALVLQAGWMIEDDQVRDAILTLRTALDQSPQNIPAINMLAAAYERDGNRDLMGEALLLASTTSGFAPEESLRYAQFLISREKLRSAEDVLIRSLRAQPGNVALLQALGETYLLLSDWPRVEQVISTLDRLEDDPQARDMATALQATLLTRMQRTDESIQLLRNVIEEGRGGLAAHAAVVRAHLANGEVEPARVYLDQVLNENTDDESETGLLFLNAALMAVEGDYEGAQQTYRSILEETPEAEIVWRALVATVLRENDEMAEQEAVQILDEALVNIPESSTLLWMKASLAERSGDVDGAIAIYEEMYENNSSSSIVANNLASLITTHRSDEASLQQAYVIARRLRGSDLPAFQDTYGWIAYRMGNLNEAEEYLSAAAAGLPSDPLVQYHLGKALAALNRTEDATEQFEKALDIWGDAPVPQAADARSELERLALASAPQPATPVAQPTAAAPQPAE